MRALVAADEPALQGLLRRIYGDTYSYRTLYQPGGIAALIASGRAALWGDFAEDDRALISHTGFFWKDPRGDYLESGLSLRHPSLRPVTSDAEVWRRFFEWLDRAAAYLHQHTTTYHPLAQRYAERHMRARPCGFVFDYAVGEKLAAFATPDAPMHALMMTTLLAPTHPQPAAAIPTGPWADFLTGCAASLGLTATVVDDSKIYDVNPSKIYNVNSIPLEVSPIEHNRDLGLLRRSIARADVAAIADAGEARAREAVAGGPAAVIAGAAEARVDLIHVPMDGRVGALAGLIERGWVPVGLRAHATRPHEIVTQYLPGSRRQYARDALAGARLGPAAAALATAWSEGCARAT